MQVNMHEAKTKLSQLVDAALEGEVVTIARAGKPVAKLVPIEDQPLFGALAGWDFDLEVFNELDAEIQDDFDTAIDSE